MNRYLIALDLDGTTLNADGQLSAGTIAVLQAAQAAGHLVVIATGRPDAISEQFYDALKLQGPMINFNGALIHMPHRHWQYEKEVTIPIPVALSLRQLKQEFAFKVMVAEGKRLLVADRPYANIPFLPDRLHPDALLDEQGLRQAPISVTMFMEAKIFKPVAAQVAALYPHLAAKTWGAWSGEYTALEVTSRNTSKFRALAYVAGCYGIDQSHIIAFGDDMNDLDMLQFAGHGVAMKNARPAILAAADAHTPTDNEHDGVADYLADYLKLA
ncbi:HAD family phosphatase [Lacticaseibacillus zeae]|uniref:HAD family phosphatase n=1 Tax=Lacticaseibacillus zeae TaxID=57037 RepID=A0A5R8LMG0_LACZE|nr:Cof-type HAD-IIB family hydrolase [Lacticaseibacillus zeae]TLF38397.1 HAD family phosphatase [Lacticaseibacillus zeae]